MKALFPLHPAMYIIATLTSLSIMLIVDYLLGATAEHLNAWGIVNRLLGRPTSVGDSLAIRQLGLTGATILTVLLNFVFGYILIKLISLTIKLFHWL